MEKKEYSIAEVITMTANVLEKIEVPVALIETIGFPIKSCVGNLRKCVTAMNEAQAAQEKETEKDGAGDGE